jgi:hypothetical protein
MVVLAVATVELTAAVPGGAHEEGRIVREGINTIASGIARHMTRAQAHSQ